MLKKAAVSAGVFAVSMLAAGAVAFAQTSTPSPTSTVSPTGSTTTSPSPSVPSGAPATGMAH